MLHIRRSTLAAIAAPLTLALAACGSGSEGGAAALTGEPIEPTPAPEGQSWLQTAAITDMGGIRVGNPDAPLKLVEYASHTCPTCARFSEESGNRLDEYIATGVVSFELRNQVHDAIDLTLAMLVRCGDPASALPLAKEGWSNLNQIVQNAQANPQAMQQAMAAQDETRFQQVAQAAGLFDFFAARGISQDQAMQCLSEVSDAEQLVEYSSTQSDELNVTGTPTFFLNGSRIDTTLWSDVEAALQDAGAR